MTDITVHQDLKIMTVGKLKIGETFLHPVTENINKTRTYKVLGIWDNSSQPRTLIQYRSPGHILCLDVNHNLVVEEFDDFANCMVQRNEH